jgi:hypothetical protein
MGNPYELDKDMEEIVLKFKNDIIKELIDPHIELLRERIHETLKMPFSVPRIRNEICFDCGAKADHLHHVVPRIRGGTAVVPLCVKCHGKAHSLKMSTSHLIKLGMEKAKANGTKLGRRKGSRSKNIDFERLAYLRESGKSIRYIAKELGVSKSWIQRILQELKEKE